MSPEFLLAILTIARLLGIKPFKVVKSDVAAALKLPKRIDNDVEKMLNGKNPEETSDIKLSQGPKLKEAVLDLDPITLVQDILPRLENEGLGLEAGSKIADAIAYLQSQVPPTDGKSGLNKFVWRCRIIENPLYALQLMHELKLTQVEVETLQTVFPELYETITTSIITQITENFKDIHDISRNTRLMIATFLGLPILDAQTLAAYGESEAVKPTNLQTTKDDK